MEKKKDSGASFGEGDLWSDEVCPNSQPERQTTCPEPSSRAERFFKLVTDPLRKAVSQNRRRLTKENCNFDLDLTYITDRIIALGYPAEDFEKLYRNTMTDTQRFLNTQHPGAYMVFNLRGKFSYKPEKFENRVISFEMTDHHPPRLEYMAQFCREAHDFLLQNPNHVIAVHCKAGKGRTGVMICAYLVYIGFYPKPRSIMDYYSIIRTVNNKGVTIPSQRRYIYYFHHLRRSMLNYLPLLVELVGIYIECPKDVGAKDLCMRVTLGDAVVFEGAKIKAPGSWVNEYAFWRNSKRHGDDSIDFGKNFYEVEDCKKNVISRRAYGWTVPQDGRVFIEGDVRVDLFHDGVVGKEKLGHVWFNTMFVCPSFCQTCYVHGDEEDPYPDELSSISERKLQPRPKTGSASEPPTRPVTDSARSNDRDSDNQPSTSRPGDTGYRKKSKDEKKNANWRESYQIVDPPALLTHCPENSLVQLHPDGKIPRDAIKEMLIAAHEKGLVDDDYHERKARIDERGVHVPPVIAGEDKERPIAGGPCLIRRKPEEHVQCFPIYEVDRAAKKRTLPEECKIFVVTKCIDPSKPADKHLAEYYVQVSDAAQTERNLKRAAKERKTKPCPEEVTTACLSKYCEPGTADDLRSTDKKLSRYFTKQRDESPTRYPPADFKCSLYPAQSTSTEMDYTKEDILDVKKLVEGCHPELKKDESSGSHELKEHCNSDSSSSSNSSSSSSVAINGCE